MKIINAGYEVITEPSIIKKIEKIARICYKSEDAIKEGSAEKMIRSLMKNNHTAMLEHGSIIMKVDSYTADWLMHVCNTIMPTMDCSNIEAVINDLEVNSRHYLRFTERYDEDEVTEPVYIVSGNMRAWQDTLMTFVTMEVFPFEVNDAIRQATESVFGLEIEKDQYHTLVDHIEGEKPTLYATILKPEDLNYEERMIHVDETVVFTCDRGITHELVRMRACSFAQESTRYCNYSHGKLGREITVINPCFWDNDSIPYKIWKNSCEQAESAYMELTQSEEVPAQLARDVLPTSVKADIAMTTNLSEWRHIFELRACDSTGPAHPQMHEIMVPYFKCMREKYPFAFGDLKAFNED